MSINPNRGNIKIELECRDDLVAITTYDREHGKRGRFLLDKSKLDSWEWNGNSVYDCDCGNFFRMWKNGKNSLHIDIVWLSEYGDVTVRGFKQSMNIPVNMMFDMLYNGGKVKYLYKPVQRNTKVDTTKAARTIRNVIGDKYAKRALSKAMRDNFKWNGSYVTLYSNGGRNFYFVENGEWNMNGGLIYNEYNNRRYYSMHT